jgi:hypothetical protein
MSRLENSGASPRLVPAFHATASERVLVTHVVPGNFSIRVGAADDVRVAQRPSSEGAGGALLTEKLRQLQIPPALKSASFKASQHCHLG